MRSRGSGRTFWRALALLVAGARPALAQNATIDMATADVNHYLARVDAPDGGTVPVSVSGLSARRNEDPAQDHYIYFDVADTFLFESTPPEAHLTFHYYDTPPVPIWIQYDATTAIYKSTPAFVTTGTGVWKAHTVVLRDGFFGNRQNGGADFRIATTPGSAFYIDLAYIRLPAPHMPAVRISPAQHEDVRPQPWRDICSRWSEWASARARTEVLGSAGHILNSLTDEELAGCFENINNSHVLLSVDSPVLKETLDCPSGQACFNYHIPWWNRFTALGADIRSFYMDEPFFAVRRYPEVLPYSDNDAINQVIIWMRLVRNAYPHAQILQVEPYPALSAADLNWWQRALHAACAATGTPIVDFFVLDHDWDAPGWTYAGIKQVQQQSKQLGIPFGVLFWASDQKDSTWDTAWRRGIIRQGRMYRRAGIYPDLYDINDFMSIPRETVPDTTFGTYTESIRKFTEMFVRRRY